MTFTRSELRAFSLSRAVLSAAGRGLDGFEKELIEQNAEDAGEDFHPHQFRVPWSLLGRRDLSVSSAGALVGTDTDRANPADILRPASAAIQAGAVVLSGQEASLSLPKVTTGVSGAWLPDELSAITPADPVVGTVGGSPQIGGSIIVYSHQLRAQTAPESFLQRHLLGAIGQLLNRAILGGSGTGGEPEGIANNSDVDAQAGAALAWSGVLDMLEASEAANGSPSAFMAPPAIAKILRNRVKFTSTASPIWEGATIGGLPAFSTNTAPTATLTVGDFSTVVIPTWGSGPQIAVDNQTLFDTGRLQMRVLLTCDCMLTQPSTFSVASSVT